MARKYSDRSMSAGVDRALEGAERSVFFFPKANPPRSIEASTIEEAEAILAANNKDHE